MRIRVSLVLALLLALVPFSSAQKPQQSGAARILATQGPTTSPPAPTTIYTTPSGSAHFYRACGNIVVTAAGSAGTAQASVSYTSATHAYANVSTFPSFGTVPVTAQWNTAAGCFVFSADASTTISAGLTSSGVTGSPTYSYSFSLELLQ